MSEAVMVIHLDAGPDGQGRPREVCLIVDGDGNVMAIQAPVVARPDLPWVGPLPTTARGYHQLRRHAGRTPHVQEKRRGGRWRNETLRVSLGDMLGDALKRSR